MDAFRLRMVETSAGAPNPVLVHPQGEPLGQVPFKSKIPLITLGPHLVSRSGDGSEFHSLRDYQAGDSIRTVNWKASARSKDLMVNQRVHESMATVTIFLDVRAVSGAGPVRGSPINQACRAALTIATAAIHARDRVRVFAYGGGVREVATNLPGMQVQDLTRALAELKASGATPFGEALEQHLASIKSRSPFVLISGFEGDPSVVDGLREVRRRGALAVALALPIGTQPEDPAEGEPEAEAETLQTQHSELVSRLRSEGVPVVPAVPGMPLSLLFRFGGPLA